jgi:hypothetical protein
VETVTTNFTSFTMQRVHKRNRLYQDKDYEIQSLTSLVKIAKERTIEKMESPQPGSEVKLPIHELTERLTESLEEMHHNLQSLLMQKLGPDARNIIAAERARQTRAKTERLQQTEPEAKKEEAHTLADIGGDGGDELEMLNAYRERYAGMLAELAVARDSLLDLEKLFHEQRVGSSDIQKEVSDELATLEKTGEPLDELAGKKRRRRSSAVSSGSEDDKKRRGSGSRRLRRQSTRDSKGDCNDPRGFKWNMWK